MDLYVLLLDIKNGERANKKSFSFLGYAAVLNLQIFGDDSNKNHYHL
tara:strand:+ start:687 stop:827 length:141 start_codon:yes stop_codon:yes gene_type:complete